MTDVTLYTIESRERTSEAAYARPAHFTLGEGISADPERLVREAGWLPYCLDDANRRVWFVDMPPELDLSKEAFVYSAQFRLARHVLAVPYDVLPRVSEQVNPPENMVFILSIGRCGSTLLNQLFNQAEGVHSLSEPDIYSNIGLLRDADTSLNRDEEWQSLLKSCTLLWSQTAKRAGVTTLGMKFRSQAVAIMDLLYRAFPDARYLFMYREGVAWAKSVYRFLRRLDYADTTSRPEMVNLWQAMAGQQTTTFDQFIPTNQESVTLAEFFAPLWAYSLDKYLTNFVEGMPFFALRYEDLIQNPEKTLEAVFTHCRITMPQFDKVSLVFEEDSQKGTVLARDNAVDELTADQIAQFTNTLQKHPRLGKPDVLLPDLYNPEGRL